MMEAFPGLQIHVFAIRNDFFGETITVSGLITGQDLTAQIKEYQENSRKHFVEKIVIYVRRNCRKNAEDAKKGQAGVLAVTVPLRIAVGKNITQTAIPVRKL